MELKEAKIIIQAGLTWANWTSEQQETMKIALQSMSKVEEQQKVKELGEIKASLKETKEQMSTVNLSIIPQNGSIVEHKLNSSFFHCVFKEYKMTRDIS